MTVNYTPADDPNDRNSWPDATVDGIVDPGGLYQTRASITSRGGLPDHTFTMISSDGTTIVVVFNEQTLEEFYLAHKLVLEEMRKHNGTYS